MSVDWQRPDYVNSLTAWQTTSDACKGQDAIKAGKTEYLPQPNPTDMSKENKERFAQYLERAVFYPYTQRTLHGMVGMAYRKPTKIELPTALQYAIEDANGAGLGLERLSQSAMFEVLQTGRGGLLVDFPQVEGEISRAQIAKGLNPAIRLVDAMDIINWRTTAIDGKQVLTLVVIRESVAVIDGFISKDVLQYRVLELVGSVYIVSLWRSQDSSEFVKMAEYMPRDASGNMLDFIPFQFMGCQNNDTDIDNPPLYGIACLNVAHYRNSADYEDSVYLIGQPQAYLSGLTDQWRDWLVEQGIYFGSRAPFLLPESGGAGILQAAPNSLAKEAMEHKQQQMVALGAMLISDGSAVKTATQSGAETSVQHSVLSLTIVNVEDAFNKAIEWLGVFAGATGGSIEINKEFTALTLDPQMLTALISAWQSGQLPSSDLWMQLRRYGVIDETKDDETIKDELDSQDEGMNLDAPVAVANTPKKVNIKRNDDGSITGEVS